MELVIVTGMSGAGKSQAANYLEDMGYYCVDNVVPSIIPSYIHHLSIGTKPQKAAFVTDIRGGESLSEVGEILSNLKSENFNFKILFLDASDDVLARRYKENRRKHPLSEKFPSIKEAICHEREMLNNLKNIADYVIDTSIISVSQLKERILNFFFSNPTGTLKIQCKSFGFKYGPDTEADLVFDVRCLPNPFYVTELKEKTGLDKDVRDYVLNSEESKEFVKRLYDFIDISVPLYIKEGKSELTVSFGCTGGKHRSVTFALIVAEHLKKQNYDCVTVHRDIGKR